jgi:hypothetical protein
MNSSIQVASSVGRIVTLSIGHSVPAPIFQRLQQVAQKRGSQIRSFGTLLLQNSSAVFEGSEITPIEPSIQTSHTNTQNSLIEQVCEKFGVALLWFESFSEISRTVQSVGGEVE